MVGFSAGARMRPSYTGAQEQSYVIAVDGLSALRTLETLPKEIALAAQRAVNKTIDRARTDSARRMRQEVAFPASYLSPSGERLYVSQRAKGDDLEARITGRWRPTSLARFTTGSVGKPGVSVMVEPGLAKRSRRMFLLRLRAGAADLDTKSNLGLAIRLKPGEKVENKTRMVPMGKGLYLLYGPSVSTVFSRVAEEVAPDAADFLETEFNRLMELDS
jgi:hypothetical protein